MVVAYDLRIEDMTLTEALPAINSSVERRLALEYGAIFLTTATPPAKIIFANENEVSQFQNSLEIGRSLIGEHEIELQKPAMEALLRARRSAEAAGLTINPRSADSGRRSFAETLNLWNRNVGRGLDHWVSQGKMESDEAYRLWQLGVIDQVAAILSIEEERQLYFSTYFDKSILQSVAAPGASQHLSLLAFDVAEYESEEVEALLGTLGWFRTVLSDLPHFTYLGREENELPALGLMQAVRKYSNHTYRFWVPNSDLLQT